MAGLPASANSQQPNRAGGLDPRAGHVHALGIAPQLFPTYERRLGRNATVLTSLDLATGGARQTLIEMAGGHAALAIDAARIVCVAHHEPKSIVVDRSHSVLAELTASPGHVFGGHGCVCPERGILLLPQRQMTARSASDSGSILVFDIATLRQLDAIPSGGVHPHEIHLIPGADELAVSHYGDLNTPRAPFQHNVVDAKLTILNATTLRPKRHYPQNEFNAMVTHMRVDKHGWAYLVLTQYIAWPPAATGATRYQLALAELERVLGSKLDFEVPHAALNEQMLPLPLPMLRVQTQTGERQIINAGNSRHLRSQSVAYVERADAAVAVYSHSDTLVIAGPQRGVEVLPAVRLGLRGMRGVTEIPDTTMVAVMGEYRGVAVFDLEKRALIASHDTSNHGDIHLYHHAA